MADSKIVGKRKPPNAGNGRPKGIPNKVTKEVKQMILDALDKAGGVDYLVGRASDPKTASAFLTLVGKVLPLQVANAEGEKFTVEQIIRRVVDSNGNT